MTVARGASAARGVTGTRRRSSLPWALGCPGPHRGAGGAGSRLPGDGCLLAGCLLAAGDFTRSILLYGDVPMTGLRVVA
jgi:hypothetical protein